MWTPVFVLRSPLPRNERLSLIFRSYADKLQQFVAKAQGQPWPDQGAEPHVSMTSELVSVWWGGESEDRAMVRIEPIPIGDIR
jgi:hypothetical protein